MSSQTTGINWSQCQYPKSKNCKRIAELAATIRDTNKRVPVRYDAVKALLAIPNRQEEDAHGWMHGAGRAMYGLLGESAAALKAMDQIDVLQGFGGGGRGIQGDETGLCIRAAVETGLPEAVTRLISGDLGPEMSYGVFTTATSMGFGPCRRVLQEHRYLMEALRQQEYYACVAHRVRQAARTHPFDQLGAAACAMFGHTILTDQKFAPSGKPTCTIWLAEYDVHILFAHLLAGNIVEIFTPNDQYGILHTVGNATEFFITSLFDTGNHRAMMKLRDEGRFLKVVANLVNQITEPLLPHVINMYMWAGKLINLLDNTPGGSAAGPWCEDALELCTAIYRRRFAGGRGNRGVDADRLDIEGLSLMQVIPKLAGTAQYFTGARGLAWATHLCEWAPLFRNQTPMHTEEFLARWIYTSLRLWLVTFPLSDRRGIELIIRQRVLELLVTKMANPRSHPFIHYAGVLMFQVICCSANEYSGNMGHMLGKGLLLLPGKPWPEPDQRKAAVQLVGLVATHWNDVDPYVVGEARQLFDGCRSREMRELASEHFVMLSALMMDSKQRKLAQSSKQHCQMIVEAFNQQKRQPDAAAVLAGIGLLDILFMEYNSGEAVWEQFAQLIVWAGKTFAQDAAIQTAVVLALFNYSRNKVLASAIVDEGGLNVLHRTKETTRDAELKLFIEVATKDLRAA